MEGGSSGACPLDRNLSAMRFQDTPTDGESEAGSAVGVFGREKGIEDRLRDTVRDSGAVVGDRNSYPAFVSLHALDADRWIGPMPALSAQNLVSLELVDCRYMTKIHDSVVREATQLQSLVLKRCPLLQTLPEDWSRLQALQQVRCLFSV